jgi:hypothetical protein
MPLFDGFDAIVDPWLGIDDRWMGTAPRYSKKTSLDRLCNEGAAIGNGGNLAEALYRQLLNNWDGTPPTGPQNWRHAQNLALGDNNESLEITLQRTFMNFVNDEDWANEVPVASGVTGTGADSVDLVLRDGRAYSMIELKYPREDAADETPLKAAIQVLRYGLAYVFSRLNLDALDYDPNIKPILDASHVHLRLLAPARFYAPFIENSDWLQRLENSLNEGIGSIVQETNFDMTFAFEHFPEEFDWNPARRNEEERQIEVVNAFANRQRLF